MSKRLCCLIKTWGICDNCGDRCCEDHGYPLRQKIFCSRPECLEVYDEWKKELEYVTEKVMEALKNKNVYSCDGDGDNIDRRASDEIY